MSRSRRTSLRQFQEYLNGRLSSMLSGEASSSLLAVQAGKEHWLLDLSDSGEIVSLPPLTVVPLTTPSFLGLVNIRGNLHAVTDFSSFLGEEATPLNSPSARLLLVGTKYGNNAALFVSRIMGLRKPEDFEKGEHPVGRPAWDVATLVDADEQKWHRLDLGVLLSDPVFMNIAA